MTAVLIALAWLSVVPIGLAWILSGVFRRWLGLVAGLASLGMVAALCHAVESGEAVRVAGWLRVDALSGVFLLLNGFLWTITSLFAPGYFKDHVPGAPGVHADGVRAQVRARFERRFYAGLNAFCGTMMLALIFSNLGLVWVAVEITTVVSALLVALEGTDGAAEAAWKYVLIASMGLGIALLATVALFAAGSPVVGSAHALSIGALLRARGLKVAPLELAMALGTLGYGTKMGLAPVHTWLPDAHSEAPTPVSALLSGSLLAVSAYVILRFAEITERTTGGGFPHDVLLAFGLASLVLAALFLLDQHDVKRMFAYSSIEHMGIIAIGASFGVALALIGILLHVLSHGLSKAAAFYGAGTMKVKMGTKDLTKLRGAGSLLPWSGPLTLAAVAALSALPPFGTFRSEFLIIWGGFSGSHDAIAVVLVVLMGLAFAGLSWRSVRVLLAPAPEGHDRGEPSPAMVLAALACIVGLVVLGVHPPGGLMHLIDVASKQLQVPAGFLHKGRLSR